MIIFSQPPPFMDDVFYEQSLMQIKPQWDCKNHYHLRNYAPDKTYFPYSTWPHELHNVHGISVAVIVLLGIFPEVKETQLRSAQHADAEIHENVIFKYVFFYNYTFLFQFKEFKNPVTISFKYKISDKNSI